MEISMNVPSDIDIVSAVATIKNAIITSRYNAAKIVNREQLSLYLNVGKFISENSRHNHWGTNTVASISSLLKQELLGLKGFSESGIKRMRTFY